MPTHRNVRSKEKRLEFFIIEKNMSCHNTIEVSFKCDLLSLFIFYFRRKTRCNLSFKNLWPIIFQSSFAMTSEMLFLLFSKNLLHLLSWWNKKEQFLHLINVWKEWIVFFTKTYKAGLRTNCIISLIKFRHNDVARK